jgi:hypothetical protein
MGTGAGRYQPRKGTESTEEFRDTDIEHPCILLGLFRVFGVFRG